MMTLSINTIETHEHGASVAWYVGLANNGTLDIRMEDIERDHAIAAELCAIRYLLFRRHVFNVETRSGQGLKILVSCGAIKKLINGTSTKKHLRGYALFARPRLNDASFAISKKPLDVTGPQESIDLREVYETWHEPIYVPSIGHLHVTNHALDRFLERVHQAVVNDPLDSMLNRMRHEQFQEIKLPDRVIAHKARKYGQAQCVEVWGHPSSGLRFLVTRDKPKQATLLTVFRADDGT